MAESYINSEIINEWGDILLHPSILKNTNSIYRKVFWGNFLAYLLDKDTVPEEKKLFLSYCLEPEIVLRQVDKNKEEMSPFIMFLARFNLFIKNHKVCYSKYIDMLSDFIKSDDWYSRSKITDNQKIINLLLARMMDEKYLDDPKMIIEAYEMITA